MVELLLQHGAKGDQSDVNNKKATDLAASLGHQDVLSLLAGEKLSKPNKHSILYKIFKWRDEVRPLPDSSIVNFIYSLE